MDPNSGRIYTPDEAEGLPPKQRKRLIPIPGVDLRGVLHMTEAERIEWAVGQRKIRNKRKGSRAKRAAAQKAILKADVLRLAIENRASREFASAKRHHRISTQRAA